MNLRNKKKLIARTLKVGIDRIVIDQERIEEIKEAITRQDIKDLKKQKIIKIKEKKGRKKNVKRKTKKRGGSVRKKIKRRKQDYVKITRKLRKHVKGLKKKGEITREENIDLRKKIKARTFKSLGHLREAVKK
jgi:large subunit ribosomal protein L19e